jgi:heme exporter protein B
VSGPPPRPPGLLASALALARKDVLLELRSRELTLATALFVLAAFLLLHFAVAGAGETPPRLAVGLLWVTILLAALLALTRTFAPERDEGLLDGLLLAPVDRAAIWLGKVLALLAQLAALEAVALPLFWLLFLAGVNGPSPSPFLLLATVVGADVGLACTGALVASLASATRQREVLLPVLFLPVATPLLIVCVAAAIASGDGDGVARYLGIVALYDVLFAVLAWGLYEHVITE